MRSSVHLKHVLLASGGVRQRSGLRQTVLRQPETVFQGGWPRSTASRVSTLLALAPSPVLVELRFTPAASLGTGSLLPSSIAVPVALLRYLGLVVFVL